MSNPQTSYVYITLGTEPVPAGLLTVENTGGIRLARFRYGRRYLERQDAVPLDPVQLPLPQDPTQEFITPEGFELFGGIRDAAPDGWGRHVMDRAAGHLLEEVDYLLASGEDRVGALAFGPDLSGPKRLTPWQEVPATGETFNLESLLQAVQQLDHTDDLPPEHRRFLVRGSSLGGARPKATTLHQNALWIAKFGRSADRYPICRAEYAAMQLARQVNLTVPDVACTNVLGQDIYLIRRFDRLNTAGTAKIPFVSGLTLLGLHESESARGSYRALAEALRRYGSEPAQDARELWQRMVFNILCNNTDDHLRNHGFLWSGKGWTLSPLYDVVPFPQIAQERYLAIGVGREGRLATLANALSEAPAFGLTKEEAHTLAISMQQHVAKNWREICRTSGLTDQYIRRLEPCFVAADTPLPPQA